MDAALGTSQALEEHVPALAGESGTIETSARLQERRQRTKTTKALMGTKICPTTARTRIQWIPLLARPSTKVLAHPSPSSLLPLPQPTPLCAAYSALSQTAACCEQPTDAPRVQCGRRTERRVAARVFCYIDNAAARIRSEATDLRHAAFTTCTPTGTSLPDVGARRVCRVLTR